jgi:hypothetical protein
MRRALSISICLAGWMLAAHAEILDRIAVSVGNRVITETDLAREIRLTAFLNGQKPDFGPENKRQTAERLVDQLLMRADLDVSRSLLPSAEESEIELKEVKQRFADEAAYRRALAEYGITEEDLRARLKWQLTLVRFIDIRFRAGVQISDEDVRNYFNEHLRPTLEKSHPGQPISLDDYRENIERTLGSEAANQQAEQWLRRARNRTRIVYHDEVFR